ncbi:hypothetical protein SAMN02746041_02005 [Desulfacinum hydrothermale DSM 13146]|uniref:Uncharacterized protein n=1 Tax=Desulfacinum hydrothermale DSM 13146 TaxID=1121390 RepID=A0A1W1XKF4_9BACT|nr:hypothetical protein SAMN02746041_02005 [Desulfacinum hydrothermale DSM 13146]
MPVGTTRRVAPTEGVHRMVLARSFFSHSILRGCAKIALGLFGLSDKCNSTVLSDAFLSFVEAVRNPPLLLKRQAGNTGPAN